MELTGRVALVTGGSTGIGRSIAERLLDEGARVAICARTTSDLERTAEELAARAGDPVRVLAVTADVSRREDVERLRREVETGMGPPEILVNNAGIGVFGSLAELEVEDYDRVFGVNVRGLFLCAKAFAPSMIERGDGVVVNVASLAGKNSFATGIVYAASKHAVMGMSRCMMLDLRPHGVRVITVCPGSVATPFFEKQDHMTPDTSKILRPAEVAELTVEAIRLSDRGTVSEVEIRPVNP